jgi:p-hydroxybenzoate 3-monooxygenase
VRTQVGIVGAGPAGLVLSHLLARAGIESVVLEARSRDYVEKRVRAGVLEHGTVELLTQTGVGDRLAAEGLVHHGVELRFGGRGHRIPLSELTGRTITVYGQQEVVKDLIAARLAAGGRIEFDVADVAVHDLDSAAPRISYRPGDGADPVDLRCDVVAGCDGSHGVCRRSVPAGALTEHERIYPHAWLGILARTPPSSAELIYAYHERGFALHSMRSPEITRLYLQVDPTDELAAWPEERIWAELATRLATVDGFELAAGPVLERGITPLRSAVVEPMQYGRLFLAGDAAHIVPATGAKGLNLAVADVRVLADAIADFYATGRTGALAAYSATCLRRVWRVQHFSWWMTSMLHRAGGDEFADRLQRAQLEYVTSSRAAASTLAENYVGLPFGVDPLVQT